MAKKISSSLVLKIALSEWKNASRDKRELGVAKELGAEVLVLAKGDQSGIRECVDGFSVYRMSTRPLGKYVPKVINRIISVFTWAHRVRTISPQIISGHDLGGLTIGWLSSLFLKPSQRPKLVYDSHEFEAGRNARRSIFQTKLIIWWERFMIKRSALMIVVNDSIADEIVKLHKLKERPVVVRNIPPKWEIDQKICAEVREQVLGKLFGRTILMYHGAVVVGRGIEKCIELLTYDQELCLVVIGDAALDSYRRRLECAVEKLNVKDRVLFYGAVPQYELWKYIGAADMSMVIAEPIVKSYYLGLPNKLFESIQAHTPIVGSALPEIERIIHQYKIGEVCRYDDMADIYRAVKEIKENKEKREQYRENEKEASKELCWERESRRLAEAYKKIWISSFG